MSWNGTVQDYLDNGPTINLPTTNTSLVSINLANNGVYLVSGRVLLYNTSSVEDAVVCQVVDPSNPPTANNENSLPYIFAKLSAADVQPTSFGTLPVDAIWHGGAGQTIAIDCYNDPFSGSAPGPLVYFAVLTEIQVQ